MALFNSIEEGFYLCEVIFDEKEQPVDILYLDANPAAKRIIGIDLTGRRLKEINPAYEAYWCEIFGNVVQAGVSKRPEQYSQQDQKWFDFYITKTGDESSREVAVVFQDITERKRRKTGRRF